MINTVLATEFSRIPLQHARRSRLAQLFGGFLARHGLSILGVAQQDTSGVALCESPDVGGRGHGGHPQFLYHGFVKPAQQVDPPSLERRGQLVRGGRVGGVLLTNVSQCAGKIAGAADPLQRRAGRRGKVGAERDCTVVGHGSRGRGKRPPEILPRLLLVASFDRRDDEFGAPWHVEFPSHSAQFASATFDRLRIAGDDVKHSIPGSWNDLNR